MLVCYEAGPFDVFSWVRVGLARIGLRRLVSCFHCMSFWVSVAVVLTVYELRARSILLTLAIAGAASLTERFLGTATDDEGGNNG